MCKSDPYMSVGESTDMSRSPLTCGGQSRQHAPRERGGGIRTRVSPPEQRPRRSRHHVVGPWTYPGSVLHNGATCIFFYLVDPLQTYWTMTGRRSTRRQVLLASMEPISSIMACRQHANTCGKSTVGFRSCHALNGIIPVTLLVYARLRTKTDVDTASPQNCGGTPIVWSMNRVVPATVWLRRYTMVCMAR